MKSKTAKTTKTKKAAAYGGAEMNATEIALVAKKYIDMKVAAKQLEKELGALKADFIDAYANAHIEDFQDNELQANEYLLKIVNNPPKLGYATGKVVSREAKAELCEVLAAEYVTKSPATGVINQRINGDKNLKALLKARGLEVSQSTRFDVKELK